MPRRAMESAGDANFMRYAGLREENMSLSSGRSVLGIAPTVPTSSLKISCTTRHTMMARSDEGNTLLNFFGQSSMMSAASTVKNTAPAAGWKPSVK